MLYSDQVITFTTVIEQDEATGQLVCTDMYYGWWDAAANQNVRFDEQYADYETQPGNIGDMSKLNPDWHPTHQQQGASDGSAGAQDQRIRSR